MRGWRIDEAVSITAILRRLTFFLGAVCAAQAHLPVAQARTLDDGRTLTIASASLADNLGGIGVNLSLGSSKSRSKTTQTSDTGAASHLNAGGDITLTATGAGTHSDITVQGSALAAGRNLSLRADDEIRLLAARNTTEQHSAHKNSSASLTASVSQGQGRANGKSLDQLNSKVSAGDTARLASGGDTTLNGAVLEGRRIEADIGGDLEIESLQDTSTYRSTQQSAGGSLSVCIPPLCAGAAPVSGSINASNSKIKSDYASVTEQSALSAGDQGFEVAVAGNTTLTGGAITSTQTAIDQNRNRFTTGASLMLTDLANRAEYSANATSLSLGAGFSPTGALMPQGTSAGIGQDGGKAQSTTLAAISGIAGNTAARTGDKETGIAPIFDAQKVQKVQKDIEAQARITQMFGQLASKAVGDWAQTQTEQARELRRQAAAEQADDERAALEAEAQRLEGLWGDTGTLRLAAHALIGGLTGGLPGAAGAAAGTLTAPLVAAALREADIDGPLATAITGLASTAAGAVVGGTAGAAAGLNEVGNNYLSHAEATSLIAARKRQRECTDDACRQEAQGVIDHYTRLSAVRDDTLRSVCAQNSAGIGCQFHISLAREAALSYQGMGIPRYSELGEYAAQAVRMTDTPHYQPEAMKLLAARIGMPVAMLAAGTAAVTISQIVGYCTTNPAACNAAGVEIGNILVGDALPIGIGAATAAKAAAKGTLPSVGGVVRQFEQAGDRVYYRVFSGDAGLGSWLTAVPPRSSAWAQEALALPPGNKATMIQEVLVPDGTLLERSRAIPMPEWGRVRGGAEQFKLLEPGNIPRRNYGPGRPLP